MRQIETRKRGGDGFERPMAMEVDVGKLKIRENHASEMVVIETATGNPRCEGFWSAVQPGLQEEDDG